jgi:hypothetical protein
VAALRMEILAGGTDHRCLRKIARKLLELAENGDLAAIRELANRLDGLPRQSIETMNEGPATVFVGEITDEQRVAALEQLIARRRLANA